MANPQDYIVEGIEQTEAPIPGWWKAIFIGSLVFCPIYLITFNTGAPGRSMADTYERALAAASKAQLDAIGVLEPDRGTILRYMEKDNWVKVGKVIFKANCANCHGRDGQGLIGPNLTDESYKNIRNVEDIAKVIQEGANNNAMPAWKEKLSPSEVVLVAAYIASIRGTDAPGGKAAEGSEIPEWPPAPEEDVSSLPVDDDGKENPSKDSQ